MSGPKTKQEKRLDALARMESGNPDNPAKDKREKKGPRRTEDERGAEMKALRRKIGVS